MTYTIPKTVFDDKEMQIPRNRDDIFNVSAVKKINSNQNSFENSKDGNILGHIEKEHTEAVH